MLCRSHSTLSPTPASTFRRLVNPIRPLATPEQIWEITPSNSTCKSMALTPGSFRKDSRLAPSGLAGEDLVAQPQPVLYRLMFFLRGRDTPTIRFPSAVVPRPRPFFRPPPVLRL